MEYETNTIHLMFCVQCFAVSVEGDEKCPKCNAPTKQFGVMEHRVEEKEE